MKTRPIIFSAPMIQALLEGRKTMTRRLAWRDAEPNAGVPVATLWQKVKPGDLLWMRETWCAHWGRPQLHAHKLVGYSVKQSNGGWAVATEEEPIYAYYRAEDDKSPLSHVKWSSPIHMPRWASRLTLEVTAVKIERVQEISEADVIAEGIVRDRDTWKVPGTLMLASLPAVAYRLLWSELHGPDSWDANPHVVAISFKVHKRNVDEMAT